METMMTVMVIICVSVFVSAILVALADMKRYSDEDKAFKAFMEREDD